MHYKKIMFGFVIFLFSSPNFALTWEDYLKEKMEDSHTQLEARMKECNANKELLPKIEEPWFSSLDRDEKYSAASYLSYLAYQKCIESQKREYASYLMEYSAEAGSNEQMDTWLSFNKVYRGDSLDETFIKLNISPVLKFFNSHEDMKPFSLLKFLEQYEEFTPHREQ